MNISSIVPGLSGGTSGPFPYHTTDDPAYQHHHHSDEKRSISDLRLKASLDDTEIDEEEELTFPNPLARLRYQYVCYTSTSALIRY